MRVDDRPVPAVVGDRPTVSYLDAELFVAIERLPLASYTWDDDQAQWDDPTDRYVWDDLEDAYMADAICALRGIQIEAGNPDAEGRLEAGSARFTLDNADGSWSTLDGRGRLIYFAPGRKVDVWAELAGEAYWLFSGAVTVWDERPDGSIEVEAFDALSDLNQPIGEWTPGVFGQHPATRLFNICTLVGFDTDRTRFDTGDVTLHAWTTTATPLEEMQAVAVSDGGVLGCDADGTLIYFDRGWVLGRDDQEIIPVVTDNICPTPAGVVVAWDYNPVTDDDRLVNVATFTNVENIAGTARDDESVTLYGPHLLTRSNDQWTTLTEGQALAAHIVARQADPQVRIDGFTLYLHDPQQDLWLTGLDLRVGDLIRFVHDQVTVDGPHRLDFNYAVARIRHDITPTSWVVEIGTSRLVGANPLALWDAPGATWDDTPPDLWTF